MGGASLRRFRVKNHQKYDLKITKHENENGTPRDGTPVPGRPRGCPSVYKTPFDENRFQKKYLFENFEFPISKSRREPCREKLAAGLGHESAGQQCQNLAERDQEMCPHTQFVF